MGVATAALEELASAADIEGIDWASLNQSGAGLMQSDHYLEILEARWEKFYGVAQTLDISDAEWEATSPEDARSAWQAIRDELEEKANAMLDALSRGEYRVAWNEAATVYSDSMRRLIIASSAVAHTALAQHSEGTMREAVRTGHMTLQEAERDADEVSRVFTGVARLDQWGALDDLKKPEYRAVGAAPAIGGVAIVVAAVGIAAVIAAVVVFVAYLSHRNEMMEKYCFDESGAPRPDAPAWCASPTDPLSVFLAPITKGVERLTAGVGIALTVGAIIWVGSYALPRFMAAGRRA